MASDASVLVAAPVVAANAAAPPAWSPADFFDLTEGDVNTYRKVLAQQLQVRYGNAVQNCPFAVAQSGGVAFSIEDFTKARDNFMQAQALTDEKARAATMEATNSYSFVVNGCQIQWKPRISVNTGYVLKWMEQNIDKWDPAIERKAVVVNPDDELPYVEFATTGYSSILALIVATVSAYKQKGAIPDRLANAFKSIRLMVYFNGSAEEIGVLNHAENIEQAKRKRHTENDNILAMKSWMVAAARASAKGLGDSALDVYRVAVILGDPRRPTSTPTWLQKELKGLNKAPTLANKVLAVCEKHVNKKYLADHKANPIHPQMNFAALEQLHK